MCVCVSVSDGTGGGRRCCRVQSGNVDVHKSLNYSRIFLRNQLPTAVVAVESTNENFEYFIYLVFVCVLMAMVTMPDSERERNSKTCIHIGFLTHCCRALLLLLLRTAQFRSQSIHPAPSHSYFASNITLCINSNDSSLYLMALASEHVYRTIICIV